MHRPPSTLELEAAVRLSFTHSAEQLVKHVVREFPFVSSIRGLALVVAGSAEVRPEANVLRCKTNLRVDGRCSACSPHLLGVQVVLGVEVVIADADQARLGGVVPVRAQPSTIEVHDDRQEDSTLQQRAAG
jgi:hypothetical protein